METAIFPALAAILFHVLGFGMSRPLLALVALSFILTGCASLDDTDRYFLQSFQVPKPIYTKMVHRKPLSFDDITGLVQTGVPGSYIVDYLRTTKTHVRPSAAELASLRQLGASEHLIHYLSAPPEKPRRHIEPWWYEASHR